MKAMPLLTEPLRFDQKLNMILISCSTFYILYIASLYLRTELKSYFSIWIISLVLCMFPIFKLLGEFHVEPSNFGQHFVFEVCR